MSNQKCDFEKIYKDYFTPKGCYSSHLKCYEKKIDKLIYNSKYICDFCNCKFIDSDIKQIKNKWKCK